LQRDVGPSLENIPASNDNMWLGPTIESGYWSKTTGEILEAVSLLSAISELVFIDNIFKQFLKILFGKGEYQKKNSVTQFG
jgi:hypothetical protein